MQEPTPPGNTRKTRRERTASTRPSCSPSSCCCCGGFSFRFCSAANSSSAAEHSSTYWQKTAQKRQRFEAEKKNNFEANKKVSTFFCLSELKLIWVGFKFEMNSAHWFLTHFWKKDFFPRIETKKCNCYTISFFTDYT